MLCFPKPLYPTTRSSLSLHLSKASSRASGFLALQTVHHCPWREQGNRIRTKVKKSKEEETFYTQLITHAQFFSLHTGQCIHWNICIYTLTCCSINGCRNLHLNCNKAHSSNHCFHERHSTSQNTIRCRSEISLVHIYDAWFCKPRYHQQLTEMFGIAVLPGTEAPRLHFIPHWVV